MTKTPLTDQNRADIVSHYTALRFNQHRLAAMYQTSEKRIRRILVAAGVDIQAVSNRMRSESQKLRRAA